MGRYGSQARTSSKASPTRKAESSFMRTSAVGGYVERVLGVGVEASPGRRGEARPRELDEPVEIARDGRAADAGPLQQGELVLAVVDGEVVHDADGVPLRARHPLQDGQREQRL